jgi:hypothetical protein
MTVARRLRRDDGTSLSEVIVGMTLMGFFMAMFTGAIVVISGTQQKVESVSATSTQLSLAFVSLDRTVRYADAISVPAMTAGPSGAWYVELRWPKPNVGAAATERCTQLRLTKTTNPTNPGQLQQRSWDAGAAPSGSFIPIASEITNGDAAAGVTTQPFWPVAVTAGVAFQQLKINLVAAHGGSSHKTQSSTAVTFTAVNSAIPAPSAPICSENLAGTRP